MAIKEPQQRKGEPGGVVLKKQKMALYNGKKTKPLTMAQSLRTLAMVLKVGEAEARALEVVGSEFKKFTVGKAYLRAAERMRVEGATFKQAILSEDVFPRTARELINAAPTSQSLQAALVRAAKLIAQSQNVKKKLLTSMIQPGFMLALCLVFLFVASAFIIPGFVGTFAALNAETPPTVAIVLAASEVTKFVMAIIIVLVVVIAIFWISFGKNNDAVVRFTDTLAIRTPIIGPILQLSSASRMFELLTANLMTGRGEPISLESAGAGCGNEAMHFSAVLHAEKMKAGDAVLTQFADSPLYPANARYMLAAAPSVKQQIDIMNELAPEYRAEADNQLEVFSKTIEPIVNYLVYGVAGLLIVAIVVPMYAMFPALMEFGDETPDAPLPVG